MTFELYQRVDDTGFIRISHKMQVDVICSNPWMFQENLILPAIISGSTSGSTVFDTKIGNHVCSQLPFLTIHSYRSMSNLLNNLSKFSVVTFLISLSIYPSIRFLCCSKFHFIFATHHRTISPLDRLKRAALIPDILLKTGPLDSIYIIPFDFQQFSSVTSHFKWFKTLYKSGIELTRL